MNKALTIAALSAGMSMAASADIILSDDVIGLGSGPYLYSYLVEVDQGGLGFDSIGSTSFSIFGIRGYQAGSASWSDFGLGTDWLISANTVAGVTTLSFLLTDLPDGPVDNGTFMSISYLSSNLPFVTGEWGSSGVYGPEFDTVQSSTGGLVSIPSLQGPPQVPEASTVVSVAGLGMLAAGYHIRRRRATAA